MFTVDFDKRGSLSLCEYLYRSVKEQILQGNLKANEKLPSKRNLAEHLGISVITVQNAYAQLISEGYIYSLEKKGFFVMDLLLDKDAKNVEKPVVKKMLRAEEPEPVSWFMDFSSNAISYEKFPFTLWSHLMRSVLNSSDRMLLSRQGVKGVLELREAIASYLKDFRNMDVSSSQIVIGAGTEHLYSMIVQLLGRDNTYIVENPGFHKVQKVFESNGVRSIPVLIDEQGFNPQKISALCGDARGTVVHISPAHHFPTGIVMPVRRRQELLAWVQEKPGRYIIEDEYDSEFRFNGKPIPTLQSADLSQNVIYINTFSKTLSPSFRINYMVLPQKLLDSFQEKLGFYSCPVSAFEQYTLAQFIGEGYFAKHIIKMKNYYRTLRNNLIQAIKKSSLGEVCGIQEEEAGLHFLLTLSNSLDCEIFKKNLEAEGIKMPLLSDFYYSDIPENAKTTFVMNYSGVQNAMISEIVRKMENAKQKSLKCR